LAIINRSTPTEKPDLSCCLIGLTFCFAGQKRRRGSYSFNQDNAGEPVGECSISDGGATVEGEGAGNMATTKRARALSST
jgi:hypothetical protein